jgi:4-amino-4-deoxy-L-arabinose transferase-like glycosyltransferase
VLATALMFDVAARAATPDSALIFFSTLGMMGFVAATRRVHAGDYAPCGMGTRSSRLDGGLTWRGALCVYIPLALAVLAKGPVGVVLPMAVIGMFLLIVRLPACPSEASHRPASVVGRAARRLRLFAPWHFWQTFWSMRPLMAWLAVAAVAVPWYVWVGIRTDGAWLYEFFGQHNVGRALAPMEGHDGGPWYYPLAMLVGLFPWSILTLPVLIFVSRTIRHGDRWKEGLIFCACWIGVYVAVFTVARTKLPNYVTPTYPAVALLIGSFLRRWVADWRAAWLGWLRIGWASLSIAGVALAVGLVVAANQYLPGEQWMAAIGLIAVIGGLAGWIFTESGHRQAAAVTLSVTAGLLSVSLLGIGTARADIHQQNHLLLETIAARHESPEVAAFGRLEPSWVFYARQPIRLIPSSQPARAVAFLREDTNRFLITTDGDLDRLGNQLPADTKVLASVPYFLKRSQLVVVGPVSKPPRWAAPRQDARRMR